MHVLHAIIFLNNLTNYLYFYNIYFLNFKCIYAFALRETQIRIPN